ncbi:hypothetical protein Tco_0919825, partial [Tanacetum coccineum]
LSNDLGRACCESTKLSQGNPSPPFLFVHHLTIKGGLGLSDCQVGMDYKGIGLWEMVWGEQGSVLGVVVLAINRGRGGYKVGGKWGRGTVMVAGV